MNFMFTFLIHREIKNLFEESSLLSDQHDWKMIEIIPEVFHGRKGMPVFLSNYRARQTVFIISRQTMRQMLEQVKVYKEPRCKDERKISYEI